MANSRVCKIEGCGKAHLANDWCSAHYQRWRRHGNPLGGRMPNGEALAFLESAVFSFDGDDCLIWPFPRGDDGYGRVRRDGKCHLVTRVVCEHEYGPPPTPEHHAAHLCGKGHLGCCNPKHLAWKTPKENQADRLVHGTHGRGERSNFSKLTKMQAFEIRSSTKLQRELAAEYRVSQQTISDIKRHKSWFWLEASE